MPSFIYQILTGLCFTAFLTILQSIKSVPQGYQWTVERFGRFTRVLNPGLNVIVPFIDRIGTKISVRERVLDVPPQDVITKDNAMVRVDGVVFFRIFDCVKAAYEVERLQVAITNLTMTNIRTVMGDMLLDELLSNREKINATLLNTIDEATDPWGVKVNRIEIKDISPAPDLVESMARQMKAEREKRAAILDAEGYKQAEILRAEGEKQNAILCAEGERRAMILHAEADKAAKILAAEARERSAAAEAKATELMSASLKGGKKEAADYFLQKYNIDAFKALGEGENTKTVFLPFEASKMMGSLGSLTELVSSVAKKKN